MKLSISMFVIACLVAAILPTTAVAEQGDSARVEPRLNDRDYAIYQHGLYSRKEIVSGGLLGTFIGFGTGHAAQDRYRDTGWIYTVGEGTTLAAMGIGIAACNSAHDDDDDGSSWFTEAEDCSLAVALISGGVFLIFRLVETIDVWATPQVRNRRFRKIEEKRRRAAVRWAPYVAANESGGANVGLALRF